MNKVKILLIPPPTRLETQFFDEHLQRLQEDFWHFKEAQPTYIVMEEDGSAEEKREKRREVERDILFRN